jgi:hypothetical protein
MRKNVTLPAVLVFAFALSCLTIGVKVAIAQHTQDGQGFPIAGPLSIISPSNATYNSSLLTLNVTSNFLLAPNLANFSYSLDGDYNVTLPIAATFVPIEAVRTYANGTTEKCISIISYYRLSGYAELPELPDGSHNLTVFAEYQANNRVGFDSRTVYFTVSDSSATAASDIQSMSPGGKRIDSVTDQDYPSSAPSTQLSFEPPASESFPAVPIAAVSIVSMSTIVAVWVLFYWKKNRGKTK